MLQQYDQTPQTKANIVIRLRRLDDSQQIDHLICFKLLNMMFFP